MSEVTLAYAKVIKTQLVDNAKCRKVDGGSAQLIEMDRWDKLLWSRSSSGMQMVTKRARLKTIKRN